MSEQIIITIAREHGSMGHEVAVALADDLGWDLYDRDIVGQVAESENIDKDILKKFDEKPRNSILSRSYGDFNNSLEDIVAEKEFDFLRKKAEEGKSFILVGRCGDYLFKDHPGQIKIYMVGEKEARIRHIMEVFDLDRKEAEKRVKTVDKNRQKYHDSHANTKWRDVDNYDLILNTYKIGLQGSINAIKHYIELIEEKNGNS